MYWINYIVKCHLFPRGIIKLSALIPRLSKLFALIVLIVFILIMDSGFIQNLKSSLHLHHLFWLLFESR